MKFVLAIIIVPVFVFIDINFQKVLFVHFAVFRVTNTSFVVPNLLVGNQVRFYHGAFSQPFSTNNSNAQSSQNFRRPFVPRGKSYLSC